MIIALQLLVVILLLGVVAVCFVLTLGAGALYYDHRSSDYLWCAVCLALIGDISALGAVAVLQEVFTA